jgi:hypothetical protein
MGALAGALIASLALLQDPRPLGPPPPVPNTPAGERVKRVLVAHGGWDAWRRLENVDYRYVLADYDAVGNMLAPRRERHRLSLSGPMQARADFDRDEAPSVMLLSEGPCSVLAAPAAGLKQLLLAYRLFRLPFSLVDFGVQLELVERNSREWLRATWPASAEISSFWIELSFDKLNRWEQAFWSERSGEGEAFFLLETQRHDAVGGVIKETHRRVFAADRKGTPLRKIYQATTERIQFNVAFEPDVFRCPLGDSGGGPQGSIRPRR